MFCLGTVCVVRTEVSESQTALPRREITARKRGEEDWPEGGGGAHGAWSWSSRRPPCAGAKAPVLRTRIRDPVLFGRLDPDSGSKISVLKDPSDTAQSLVTNFLG